MSIRHAVRNALPVDLMPNMADEDYGGVMTNTQWPEWKLNYQHAFPPDGFGPVFFGDADLECKRKEDECVLYLDAPHGPIPARATFAFPEGPRQSYIVDEHAARMILNGETWSNMDIYFYLEGVYSETVKHLTRTETAN